MPDDSERLVVLLEARIRDFEKNFEKANRTASRNWKEIESRGKQAGERLQSSMGKAASNITDAFAGISPAVGGALGLGVVFKFAVDINRELAKMGSLAKQVGLSTDRFQELQFGANLGGVSNEGFASGIESISKLLNDSVREETDLSRLFAANNVSLKDREGKLISVNEALSKAADLVANAKSEADKIKIAQMLGLSKDWVKALEDGSVAWNKNAAGAREAGAVIDERIIERAGKFSKDWNVATTKWAAGFKSAASEILPLITDIVDTAMKAAPFMMKSASLFGTQLKAAFGGIESLSLEQLKLMEQLTRPFELGGRQFGNADENAKIRERIALLEKEGEARTKLIINKPAPKGGGTIIPGPKTDPEDKDAFSRAEDGARKRIALIEADTQAVGLNEAARERLHVVAQLEEAARRANRDAGLENVEVTDKQREAINKLADATFAAAQKNMDAKKSFASINETLQFGGQQTIQILEDIMDNSKSATDIINNLWKALRNALLQAALLGQGPLAGILGLAGTGGGTGGLFGMLAGMFKASADGNIFDRGRLVPFARGGIVSQPTIFPMARGAGLMGEAGPEAILPLKRGPDGRLGVSGASGGPAIHQTINVIDQSTRGGNAVEAQPSADGSSLEIIIKDKIAPALAADISSNRGPLRDAVRHSKANYWG
jgi:hypothetical protein